MYTAGENARVQT